MTKIDEEVAALKRIADFHRIEVSPLPQPVQLKYLFFFRNLLGSRFLAEHYNYAAWWVPESEIRVVFFTDILNSIPSIRDRLTIGSEGSSSEHTLPSFRRMYPLKGYEEINIGPRLKDLPEVERIHIIKYGNCAR